MPAPTPRNPKGAGRKPSPDEPKPTQSFRSDPDIKTYLATIPTGEKTRIINQAIREYILRQNQSHD
jgi:hypothetical protein